MEQQFIYMMIFFGLAIVIVIILLFTISWNNSTKPVPLPVELPINMQEKVPQQDTPPPLQPKENITFSYISLSDPLVSPPTPVKKMHKEEDKPKGEFGLLSAKLLTELFESIDGVVIDKPDHIDHQQAVRQSATALADSLCDQSNAETLVKSYVNLNNLLVEYTKIGRDKYLDKSTFDGLDSSLSSESDSLFAERSISPSMHLKSAPGDDSSIGKDIKTQAGILNMVINGIYCKCLDLSVESNGNFKTYLSSLNAILFRYADLVAKADWADANKIKQKALDIAKGAILTDQ